jgi:hypothetical protein
VGSRSAGIGGKRLELQDGPLRQRDPVTEHRRDEVMVGHDIDTD